MFSHSTVPSSPKPFQSVVPEATPPHNIEAEQGLLGSLLVSNASFERIASTLAPEHFYTDVHGRIYQAIATLIDRGQGASPVTLKPYFEKDPDLESVGGAAYLADLAANVISVINTEDYARTIRECHRRRVLFSVAEEIAYGALHFDPAFDDTAPLIESAEAQLYAIAENSVQAHDFKSIADFADEAAEQAEKAFKNGGGVTGVTTGITGLDTKLGGLQPTDLVILAARPSMGKTALAANIAFNAARAYLETQGDKGAVVGFFSLEMSGAQLAARIMAELSQIPNDTVRRGAAKAADVRAFVDTAHAMKDLPFYIDDSGALTISALRSRARRLKRKKGLGLIVVDYLQLMRGTGSRQANDNRVVEVSEITRGLKAIAKELQVPILALSQLSRAVETREEKRPQLSDLRESGSIEQDADVVMFIYREEYYLEKSEPEVGTDRHLEWQEQLSKALNVAEVIIGKQRHGPVGIVKLRFDPKLTKFEDLKS
jgi:replicative DNA helicase